MNYILNGQANGSVAETLMNNNFDANALRPYVGQDGRSYITQIQNGKPVAMVTNAPATLRKDEWKLLDDVVIPVAKERLQVVSDLRSAGLQFVIPNGMGKTVLETETQTDISDATISMDGLAAGNRDRPTYNLTNLPLPIIHKDFSYSARQIMTSRNGGSPLDTTSASLAARRVAELAEKLALGIAPSYLYGGGTIYGLTNFPSRVTLAMTTPTGIPTNATTIQEILSMIDSLQLKFHHGPFRLYNSPSWDKFLDDDYSTAKGDNTLRDRILKIRKIQSIDTADFLTGFQMILVQQTSDVIREVVGMDITTLQWESHGGMQINFKVMAILVPQLRADSAGNTGIAHGTA